MPTRIVPMTGWEIANRVAASVRLAANPSFTRGIRREARYIGLVAQSRADRLGWRARNRMTLCRSGQRTAGEHADADDTNPGRAGVIEQAPIILGRIVRR